MVAVGRALLALGVAGTFVLFFFLLIRVQTCVSEIDNGVCRVGTVVVVGRGGGAEVTMCLAGIEAT